MSKTDATITLTVTLSGAETTAIVKAAGALGWVPSGVPKAVEIDHGRSKKGEPLDGALAKCTKHLLADYPEPGMVVVHVGQIVRLIRADVRVTLPALLEQLATVPFELASFGSIHDAWLDGSLGETYRPPGFGDWHVSLGWAAAFKGAGHDRLVSRRWLDDGPWKLWKGAGDISLVQFHDLDADAATALAQARPGHDQLGIGPSGGFLQKPFNYRFELSGLYDAATRAFKVVVLGRDLADRELLEWAAARADGKLASGKPVDTLAFVFPDESEAKKNLARLARYGFQVWAIRAGDEVRLDA